MRKVLLTTALLIATAMPAAAAEFYCSGKGEVVVLLKKETTGGEIICVKERIPFKDYIAIPEKPNEIIFAQCNKTRGGNK